MQLGTLKLVVLTGCKTLQLGIALRRVGLVEAVSCWETVLEDEAGKLFGEAFALARARDETPQQAQDAACQAVLAATEQRHLDTGLGAWVQKFELIDPDDALLVHQSGPNRKRLVQPANIHPRMAAGVPVLLDDRAPLQADLPLGMPAPSAMARCVRRDPEVGDLVTSLMGASSTTAVLGLRGMGGVGKTLLAAAALCEAPVRKYYREGILWLPIGLNGSKRLHALLRQAADDLHNNLLVSRFGARDPPERSLDVAGLTAWITSRVGHRRVMCVLDDVWEPEVVQAFAATRMVLFVTTRRADVALTAGGDVIDVDIVDDATARCMLARAADCEVDTLPTYADGVLRACCGLPMALAMAGALIAHGTGWEDVTAEWKAAYDEQPHDDAVLQPDQRQDWSLQAMVKVSVNRLPLELRAAYLGLALAPKRLPLEEELFCVLSGCSDAAEWKEALAGHSLLQLAQDGTCMAHDLQLDYLQRVGAPDGAKQRLMDWLMSPATLFRLCEGESLTNSAGGSLGTFALSVAALWRQLAGAGDAAQVAGQAYTDVAENDGFASREEDEEGHVVARVMWMLGAADVLFELGNFASARRLVEPSVRSLRIVYGDTHPATLTYIINLGLLLKTMGDLVGAALLYREALVGRRATLGDTHQKTIASFNSLGTLLKEQGDLAGAAPLLREALASRRETLGDRHPDTLTSIHSFGSLLHAQGDLARAKELFDEALTARRETLGDRHPNTLISIHDLGSLLKAQGHFAGAALLLHEALASSRSTLGDRHSGTLASLNGLGTLLQAQGDLAGAAPLLCEALAARRETLGDKHPDTLSSINSLGLLLRAQDNLTGAEPLLQEAMVGRRETLGDRHIDTLASIGNFALLLQGKSDFFGAEPLYREALAACRATLADVHPATLSSAHNLGTLLHAQRDLNGAAPLLREALDGRRATLGNTHQDTLESINNLGALLQEQDDLAGAAELFDEGLTASRATLGDRHPATLSYISNLGSLLGAQGDLAGAAPLLCEALASRRETLGNRHRKTVLSIDSVAELLHTQGDLTGAEELLREALAAKRATLGNTHPNTLASLNNLAAMVHNQGDKVQATLLLSELRAANKLVADARRAHFKLWKVKPNELCQCASGKKFKKCCGKPGS